MKSSSILLCVFFIIINSCSTKAKDTSNAIDTTAASKTVSTVNKEITDRDSVRNRNLAETKQKEITVGSETFKKIVDYIWKYGFSITGGPHNELPGREYVFNDSAGNRHGLLAIKNEAGVVQSIFIYGFKDGIKDQAHFFPYVITPEKVYTDIPDVDGSWRDADIVKAGYEQFLKKVNNKAK